MIHTFSRFFSLAIGILNTRRHQANGQRFIDSLADDAQNISANYGFVNASKEELSPKPL